MPRSQAPDWLRDLGWAEVYEVRRIIGRGGMGCVYEGWHLTLNIPVALKIIDPHLVGEDHVRARFEKEAMTLARLQEPVPHPNIVRVIDFKLLDSVGCIVMAYVKGMDIRAWCVDQEETLTRRVALMEQVARAAGYFHSFGLVHRDLKPANVLVSEKSREPVIVDFGIVRGREDVTLTRTQQALGTAAYMAPELLGVEKKEIITRSTDADAADRAPGEISPAADVYSLGVMLYELLSGELPYGSTLVEVLPRHQKESVPNTITKRPARIPRDLERICLKAIAHRSSERYANGTLLAEDIARFLRGEPVHARPISKIRHAARRARRRPVLSVLAVAGFMIACLVLVVLVWDARRVRLARLREKISINMPISSWSADMMLKTDRLIDELEVEEPEQAAAFHNTLVKGAVREVLHILKKPVISQADREEIQRTLLWLDKHDRAQSQSLHQTVEERNVRWDTWLELSPPFANLAEQIPSARVEDGMVVLAGQKFNERALRLERPAPLDISVSFLIPPEGAQTLGFKVRLFGQWYKMHLLQPPPTAVTAHMRYFQHVSKRPDSVLLIARKDRILAVSPVEQPPVPGRPYSMKLHIEDRQISLSAGEGDHVEHRMRYQSVEPVQVMLTGIPDFRLQNLSWTGPSSLPDSSPLEKGDLDAGSERWGSAEAHFRELSGDPEYGVEALFKVGDCQWQLGREAEAQATWEKVMSGPDSPWRSEACLQLWYLHANAGRLEEARVYLDQLPRPEDMPADFLAQLQRPGREIDDIYRSTGRGLNLLRLMPDVEDAIRVHRMLRYTPQDLAVRFALARHFNGIDEGARELLYNGLKLKNVARLNSADETTLNTCFELWSMISPSELDAALEMHHSHWLERLPPDHSLAGTIRMDQARRLAREGKKEEAIRIARQVLEAPQATIMAFTGAALLISALENAETGKEVARQALDRVSRSPRQIQELTLLNRLLLHCETRGWTSQQMVDVLSQWLSFGESGENRETLRSRLCRLLLEDEAMVHSLNHLLDDAAGDKILQAFALRSQPIRKSVQEMFYGLFRRQVIFSMYGHRASSEQMVAAAGVTRHWLDAFAKNKITVEDFLMLMELARTPAPALQAAKARWPEPLKKAVERAFAVKRS